MSHVSSFHVHERADFITMYLWNIVCSVIHMLTVTLRSYGFGTVLHLSRHTAPAEQSSFFRSKRLGNPTRFELSKSSDLSLSQDRQLNLEQQGEGTPFVFLFKQVFFLQPWVSLSHRRRHLSRIKSIPKRIWVCNNS